MGPGGGSHVTPTAQHLDGFVVVAPPSAALALTCGRKCHPADTVGERPRVRRDAGPLAGVRSSASADDPRQLVDGRPRVPPRGPSRPRHGSDPPPTARATLDRRREDVRCAVTVYSAGGRISTAGISDVVTTLDSVTGSEIVAARLSNGAGVCCAARPGDRQTSQQVTSTRQRPTGFRHVVATWLLPVRGCTMRTRP